MAGIILQVILIFFVLLIGLIVIYVILMLLKANRLTIKDPYDKARYITPYLMTERKDKSTGIIKWHSVLWQRKLVTDKPPDGAIEIGSKGIKYAQCYRISEDEYYWIKDEGIRIDKEITESVDKDGEPIKTEKLVIYDIQEEGDQVVIDTFRPLSTTQRDVLVSQTMKSAEISKGQWTPEKVASLVSVGILGAIIIMALIFMPDLYIEKQKWASTVFAITEKQHDIAEKVAIILATGCSGAEHLDVQLTQNAVPQSGGVIISDSETPPE